MTHFSEKSRCKGFSRKFHSPGVIRLGTRSTGCSLALSQASPKAPGGRKPDPRQIPVQPARRSVSGAGSLTRQPYPFRSFRRPIVFSLAPLRIPRVDFVSVGDRETRWAHPLEALVEFVARRVA